MRQKSETHKGRVIRIDPDFTEVELINPASKEYGRHFETAFLQDCGITGVGEGLELVFEKRTYGTWGIVIMCIKPTGEQVGGFTEEELARTIAELDLVDLAKIAEKFGAITV